MTDAISVKVEPKDKNVCTLTRETENMAGQHRADNLNTSIFNKQ